MLKKLLISLLIALPVVTFSEFDTGRLLYKISHSNHIGGAPALHAKNALTEGNRSVYIGMPYDDVLTQFGDPADVLPSEYGFAWNIFHENFQNYIQIGVSGNRVVGIYTNSPRFSYQGISAGASITDVNMVFESPLAYIRKGTTKYIMEGVNDDRTKMELFLIDNVYVTVFYDVFKNNSVTSVNIIEYDTEQSFRRLYGVPSEALRESFELQNFYVTNALRVREGFPAFSYHNGIAKVAYGHSLEMAENVYFDHTDLSGGSVGERAKAGNVAYRAAGENIAMGAQNSLHMHELLMNSEGHRKNLLSDYNAMGVGVAFSEDDTPYLTQNFLK